MQTVYDPDGCVLELVELAMTEYHAGEAQFRGDLISGLNAEVRGDCLIAMFWEGVRSVFISLFAELLMG